jgi:predicted transglutaminase-like cysteine proteinase
MIIRSVSRRTALATLGSGFAALAVGFPRPAFAAARRGLFGSIETRRDNPARFPKWQGALDRYFAEAPTAGQACSGSRCELQQWQAFLDGLAGQAPMAQIEAVHTEMNRYRYILDPINWNLPDYWASPGQFLRRNGDCEDYGIVKFMSLRALGVPSDRMRVVVLQDINLGVAHAVMSIEQDGRTLILDNQISQVVPHETIRHYKPIYSVNESHWWLHRA